MTILSLDSLTLTDTAPQVAIQAAAEAGYDACSLWIIPPPLFPSPLLTLEHERECAAILNLIVAAMLLAEHRRSKATA